MFYANTFGSIKLHKYSVYVLAAEYPDLLLKVELSEMTGTDLEPA